MSKWLVVSLALGAFLALVVASLVSADHKLFRGKLTNENGVEVESSDGAAPGKFRRLFGARDSIEDGNGRFHLGRHDDCPNAKNKSDCHSCCNSYDKSSKFQHFKLSLRPIKIGKCVCFTRATL